MKNLIILLTLILSLTSCQHLVRFVDMTSNVKQTKNQEKTLYYTFRVLDKNLNFKYIEEFQNPKTFFYRDVSHLEVLDTLQWASETPYQLGK